MQHIVLQIPDTCPKCGEEGLVLADTRLRHTVAVLVWSCAACGSEWPVSSDDVVPERRHSPDRRRISRTERRRADSLNP
jgi:hypothetical protein